MDSPTPHLHLHRDSGPWVFVLPGVVVGSSAVASAFFLPDRADIAVWWAFGAGLVAVVSFVAGLIRARNLVCAAALDLPLGTRRDRAKSQAVLKAVLRADRSGREALYGAAARSLAACLSAGQECVPVMGEYARHVANGEGHEESVDRLADRAQDLFER